MKRFMQTPTFRIIVGVQVLLQIAALADLLRQHEVGRGHKWMWALVIPAFGYGGPVAYWLFGRPKQSPPFGQLSHGVGDAEHSGEHR